ncbi:DUF3189 family protein [Alkaliphilus hydrothermalis]|uniref:DUF3189 domain-containing protein n=1 Tax=Alkaliphilus hydrothermalis TaxID=1482730 RepID=A0ABS2NPC5_9FIRM|nr:DUF3189 family protein [Alkaliphilus hydrothermalis]MBM7614764.1 hypothetical protein [Alkaliphilus hydrothermalis]
MYIVYYGVNNSIVVSVAAAIHLANFSVEAPQKEYSKNLHQFFSKNQEALGRLLYVGNDQEDNKVFVLNVANSETILLPALQSVFDILQVPNQKLYLADTTSVDNISIYLGMFLYKYNLLPSTAIYLLFKGIMKEKDKFHKIVSTAKIFSKKK